MRSIRTLPLALFASTLAGGLLASSQASAQASFPYVVTELARPYTALSRGTLLTFASSSRDDGGEVVQLPFAFTYFGQTFNAINVAVNGHLTFAESCAGGQRCNQGSCNANNICAENFMATSPPFGTPSLPNISRANQFVAPFWDDLILGTGSEIRVGTVGTAPNREFVVQWSDIQRFSRSLSTADFQVRLVEGSNIIRIAYGTFGSASDNSVWSGLIGAESPDGRTGLTTQTCAATNNCTAQTLIGLNNRTIEIGLPDGAELVGEATAPTGGDVGSPLPFALTVRNIGTNTTTVGFESRVYISTDATIDRGDRELGVLNFPALAAGGTNTQTLNAVVPSLPLGVYTVGALVDTSSVVPEAIETNNAVVAQSRFLIGADLRVSTSAPSTGGIGDPISVSVNILNDGSAQPAVGVDVFLSQDQTLDAGDAFVGSATTAVGAVPSTPLTVNGTIPTTLRDGNFYIIALADPGNRIAESDETNNVGVSSGQVALRTADLEVVSIAVDRDIAFRGGQLTVTTVIENTGLAGANGFSYDFYLSTNRLISRISDPLLGSAGPLTLAPGEQQTVNHTFTISSSVAIGLYHAGVIVNSNGAVPETSFTRNVRPTPNQFTVRDPGPDFTLAQIATPPSGAAGERLLVERAIFNLGNAAGSAEYEVFLSEDATLDPMSDRRLLTASTTIALGGEDLGVDAIRLPVDVAAGSYYVLYRLDPADRVDELDETNNIGGLTAPITIASQQLAILTESLPFGTVGVPYGVVLGATGGAGAYVWTVSQGSLPDGVSLDPMAGALSGTPTREGVSAFTLRVTDGQLAVERAYRLLVAEPSAAPEVLTRTLPVAFENKPYAAELTLFGGAPPFTWELRGNLPSGISFDPSGVFRGTPTSVDLRMISVVATDALGQTADRSLVLRVVRPSSSVRLASTALPDGRIGDMYNATLAVADSTGVMPFTFDIIGGALPPGRELTGDTISGTPARAGLFDIEVRVIDGQRDLDINRYIIEIAERNGVRFLTADLPPAEIATAYTEANGDSVRLRAVSEAGSEDVQFTRVSGALPNGVSLGLDGTLTGTPAATGLFDFVAQAEDTSGQRSLRAFALVVNDPPAPPPPLPTDPGGCACAAPRERAPVALWLVLLLGALVVGSRRRGVGGLALGLVLGFAGTAQAQQQVGAYRVNQVNQAYVPRTTGGQALRFSSTDDGSATINLPFAYTYFGQSFTSVQVSTNGYIVFGSGNARSLSNRASPSTIQPNNLIAVAWDDNETRGEQWFVEGTAPNRRVIIQYQNMNRLGGPSDGRVQAQVHLIEGRSRFEVHYGGVAGGGGGTPRWTFSAGFEGPQGRVGLDFLGCGQSCNRPNVPNGRVFVAEEDGGTDVVARRVSGPVTAFPGSPANLELVVASAHANSLGPFDYAVYLVPAGSTTPSGAPLATASLFLQPFEVRTIRSTVNVPVDVPLGRYRFALVVDSGGVIREPNENDNLAFSDFVRVDTPRPDLVAEAIGTSNMMVAPGGTLPVSYRVSNRGGVPVDVDVSVVLSRNEVITADDRRVDTQRLSIPAASSSSVTPSVTVPVDVPAGSYTLGLVADPMDAVQEGSEVNNTVAAAAPLLVASGSLAITDERLPPAYVNVPYTTYLSAVGGEGDYAWSLASGTLPRGLFLLSTTGEIRGTPLETGRAMITAQVRSGQGTATRDLQLTVGEAVGALTIVTRRLLPGTVGQDYPPVEMGQMPQRLRALGGTGTVAFSLDSPAPPGIELAPDGRFFGRPTQAGRFSVDVRATDGAGATATRTLFLTVGEPGRVTVVADPLPDARLGSPYAFQLRVLGITSTVAPLFSSEGPLPRGLVVASTGVLGGTPRQVGVFEFPVTVMEGAMGQTDSALFRIEVRPDDELGFRVEGTTTTTAGAALDVSLVAIGGTPPYAWRGDDELPDGLQSEVEGAEGRTLRIRGTLTEPGVATFLPTITDADQRVYRAPVSLRFLPEPPPPPVMGGGGGCRAAGRPAEASGIGSGLALLVLGLGLRRRRRR